MEEIPGLNEIIPPGGGKQPRQPEPQPAPRTSPDAQTPRPAAPAPAPQSGQQPPSGAHSPSVSSADLNQPTIVAALFLSAPFFGITGLIGLVLAYVWRSEKPMGWEATHYTYMIRGFWLWLGGVIIGFLLTFFIVGIFIILGAYALIVVRGVLSIMRAQKQEPMPDPQTWLA